MADLGFGFAGRGRGRRLYVEPAVTDHYDGFVMVDDDALPGAAAGGSLYRPPSSPACAGGSSSVDGGASGCTGGGVGSGSGFGAGGSVGAGGSSTGAASRAVATRGCPAPAVNQYMNSHEASLYADGSAMNRHEASLYAPAARSNLPPDAAPMPTLDETRAAAASRQVAAVWSQRRGSRRGTVAEDSAHPCAVIASGPTYSETPFTTVPRRFRPDACIMAGASTSAPAAPPHRGSQAASGFGGGSGFGGPSGVIGAVGGYEGESGGIYRAPVRCHRRINSRAPARTAFRKTKHPPLYPHLLWTNGLLPPSALESIAPLGLTTSPIRNQTAPLPPSRLDKPAL